MMSRDFCYWLQGYFEVTSVTRKVDTLTGAQIDCIKNHLNMVFVHDIDPSMPQPAAPTSHQSLLQQVHEGGGGSASPFRPDTARPRC